jgi:glutathione S-transferase
MTLTLYFAPGASSMAVHIALHEVGAAFEARPISLGKGEQRTPAYLAINPEGKVPTLLIDGRRLTEVAGILFYLAKRFPAASLLPDDIEGEAQAVSWMSFIAATLHPARARGIEYATQVYTLADRRLAHVPAKWTPVRRQEHAQTEESRACSDSEGTEHARGARDWALGRYSVVDIHLFRLYWRLANSLKPAPGTFPNLDAHYHRMMARPAVRRTCEIEAAVGYELPK